MDPALKADDLLPLINKLPHDEQVRLARLALRAAADAGDDADAYRANSPTDDEFGGDDEAAAWEAEGWEEFYASR
jgi:hypothetical protein